MNYVRNCWHKLLVIDRMEDVKKSILFCSALCTSQTVQEDFFDILSRVVVEACITSWLQPNFYSSCSGGGKTQKSHGEKQGLQCGCATGVPWKLRLVLKLKLVSLQKHWFLTPSLSPNCIPQSSLCIVLTIYSLLHRDPFFKNNAIGVKKQHRFSVEGSVNFFCGGKPFASKHLIAVFIQDQHV